MAEEIKNPKTVDDAPLGEGSTSSTQPNIGPSASETAPQPTVNPAPETAPQPTVNPAPETAPQPTVNPGGSVTMTQEQFDAVMARVGLLETELELRGKADDVHTKGRIEDLRRQGKLMLSMKLRSVDGKLVVGWRTLQDDVFFQDGRLIENQKIEIWFKDGEKKELTMRQWATVANYVQCEVLSQSTDADGNKFVKIQTPDGETLDVNVNFVN